MKGNALAGPLKRYHFKDSSSLLENEVLMQSDYELNIHKDLHSRKSNLLRRISEWTVCPESYRGRLYKKLQMIDVLKKAAISKLDEMIREIGIIEFDLQLNPTWVRGLMKQVDEILDQTKQEQRGELITELSHLKEQFGLLKNACNHYHLTR